MIKTLEAGQFPATRKETSSAATILLASELGPYKHVYSSAHRWNERNYLTSLGYAGHVASRAVNVLHDTNVKPSELYTKYRGNAYQPHILDFEEDPQMRAFAVTLYDPDLLRAEVLSGEAPFQSLSRRAAVDLMFLLVDVEPLPLLKCVE